MFRSIAAITVMLMVSLAGVQAFASNDQAATAENRYTLKPNTRLAEKDNLKAFCFSPVDSVTHYLGANVGEEDLPGPLSLDPETADAAAWTVRLGAGVERHLSETAAFDIDYRYVSTPVELDFDTLQLPSGHEHHISAGLKFRF